MALNTVNTILATIQTRHGIEADFDADKMTIGEWSLSTDKKIVRICIMPGLCIRMATYEAFEEDMKEVQIILATCQNIQAAVEELADLAEQHKNNAAASAEAAEGFSDLSKSYAIGTDGEVRENDDIDNSKYYYEQSKRLTQGFNGIVPMGTISFADLDNPENQVAKYMFNISDAFTSDSRFKDGGGKYYDVGTNVVRTADNMWDALASSSDQSVVFSESSTRTNIDSGEKLSVMFGKIKKWFADLKPVAFSNSYTDLDNKPSIPTLTNNLLATEPGTALDAVQGKALDDKITQINSDLANLIIYRKLTMINDQITIGTKDVKYFNIEKYTINGYEFLGGSIREWHGQRSGYLQITFSETIMSVYNPLEYDASLFGVVFVFVYIKI